MMAVGAYYPELAGGSLQCRTLVLALRDRVAFSVLTTTADRSLLVRSQVDGVNVHRVYIDVRSPMTKLTGALAMLGLVPALARDHDIFHFHGFTEKMLLLFSAAKISGRRTIEKMTSVGWDDPVAIQSRPFGALLAAAQSRADRLVAVTPAMRERCAMAGVPDNVVRDIPNGVDVDRFAPVDREARVALRERLGLPAAACIVTFVGFWSREKGPHALFDAWQQARAATSADTALLYIGSTDPAHAEVDASLVASVRGRIAAEGIADRVLFVEHTSDVAAYLQVSDVFVLPSSREGLSNALLEAMSTGLPCIAATIPGVSDWVIEHGRSGFIVPHDDTGALAGTIARLLQNEQLRSETGRRARATIVERFSIRSVADAYFALYSELC